MKKLQGLAYFLATATATLGFAQAQQQVLLNTAPSNGNDNNLRVSEEIIKKPTGNANPDEFIRPGDRCLYIIQVENVSHRNYAVGEFTIMDTHKSINLPRQEYVAGRCRYKSNDSGLVAVCINEGHNDHTKGVSNPLPLAMRGGMATITFEVIVRGPEDLDDVKLSSTGYVTQPDFLGQPDLPFYAETECILEPAISIQKTVHKGHLLTSFSSCSTIRTSSSSSSTDAERQLVTGAVGDPITYCYKVTNTGNSYLKNIVVTDPDVGFGGQTINTNSNVMLTPLTVDPSDSDSAAHTTWVKFQSTIPPSGSSSGGGGGEHNTTATAVGEPVLVGGGVISNYFGGPVSDTDDGGAAAVVVVVEEEVAGPRILGVRTSSIRIEKTVHLDDIRTTTCAAVDGNELQYGFKNEVITYCYKIINTGKVNLKDLVVKDDNVPTTTSSTTTTTAAGVTGSGGGGAAAYDDEFLIGTLDVEEIKFVRKLSFIDGDLNSAAVVVGTPIDGSGPVTDNDTAGVEEIPARVCAI